MARVLKDLKKFNTKNIIKKQSTLGDIRFGLLGNAAKNSCGIISLHNLKVILGLNTNFFEDYKRASKWGTNLAVGVFGTNPFYINRKLSQLKLNKKAYVKPNNSKLHEIFEKHDLIIMAYSWGNMMDLHYAVFETNKDGTITGHNSNHHNGYNCVSTLINDEPITKTIVAWGINKDN